MEIIFQLLKIFFLEFENDKLPFSLFRLRVNPFNSLKAFPGRKKDLSDFFFSLKRIQKKKSKSKKTFSKHRHLPIDGTKETSSPSENLIFVDATQKNVLRIDRQTSASERHKLKNIISDHVMHVASRGVWKENKRLWGKTILF